MSDVPDWLKAAIDHLKSAPEGMTPEQWAARIHEALEIVEVKKYATPESRFAFKFAGASEEEVAEIRRHLSDFENSIVEIERKIDFKIGPNGEWIRCGKCGMRSYNRNDVENRYCANCNLWLEK